MRASLGSKITLSQKGNVSTIFSQASERSKATSKLDLNKFVGIIDFDEKNATVTVGGKTPFKMLTEFLIPRGLCPQVVPELDTITVGGAISGVGIESSSFRHGFVHNSMIEFDVLMGDGRVSKQASKRIKICFVVSHSYATFGYNVCKLKLMKKRCSHCAKRMCHCETKKCTQEEKEDRADLLKVSCLTRTMHLFYGNVHDKLSASTRVDYHVTSFQRYS